MKPSALSSAVAKAVLVAAVCTAGSAQATLFSYTGSASFAVTDAASLPTPATIAGSNPGLAQGLFLSALASHTTETFESYAGPTGGLPGTLAFPGTLFGGAAAVSHGALNDANDGVENRPCSTDPSSGTEICTGRYNTSNGGSKWLQSDTSFTLNFDQAFSAFGFYGIDFGDFAGGLTVTLTDSQSGFHSSVADIGKGASGNGYLIFVGLTDDAHTYDQIRFDIAQCDPQQTNCTPPDILGFDDLIVGNIKTDNGGGGNVPEPASLGLAGLGLVLLAAARRRRA